MREDKKKKVEEDIKQKKELVEAELFIEIEEQRRIR